MKPAADGMMTVFTDQPGLQFYSGNFLDGSAKGKNGCRVWPQERPLSGNPGVPRHAEQTAIPVGDAAAGTTYRQTTIYHFSTK